MTIELYIIIVSLINILLAADFSFRIGTFSRVLNVVHSYLLQKQGCKIY